MINIVLSFFSSFIGLVTVLYSLFKLIVVKKNYEKVNAVCIQVNSHVSHHHDGDITMYQPVWEYYYNCQKYTSAMNSSDSYINIQVGTEREIYINSDDPLEIYTVFLKSIICQTLLGLLFFAGGALGIIFKYNN